MIFSKIAGDISEIAGDLAISEQSVKKIIIPALNSPGDHGNIVKTGSRVILNLYGDPPYKNQTSEKHYKVPTKALPPMRDFAFLILDKYCTFVCGSLFRGIKLN